LEQTGGWPRNSLIVGSLTKIKADGRDIVTSGTDVADIYLDPADFDTEGSSEVSGAFGEIMQQMVLKGLAEDEMSAKQLLIGTYSYRQPFSSRESSREYITVLDWNKLKNDLLTSPAP